MTAEAAHFGAAARKMGPAVCSWVIVTVMWAILQQREKVGGITDVVLSVFIFVAPLSPLFLGFFYFNKTFLIVRS